MPTRKRKPIEANDGSYGGKVLAAFDQMSDGRCPNCGYTKVDSAMWGDHNLCKGEIPQSKSGGPSSKPDNTDNHVAWLRFRNRQDNQQPYLIICDSDAPGAFKVYRRPVDGVASCCCEFCTEDK